MIKKRKIWIRISKGFKEANKFDDFYSLSLTPRQRLEDTQFCREQYFYLKGEKYAGRKGLCRVIKIIKKKQS